MNQPENSRRDFLKQSIPLSLGIASLGAIPALALNPLKRAAGQYSVPVRQITHGPKFHWFGYYDKLQFDPTSRFVLGMQVDFEHRTPKADDVIKIGMVDLEENDQWTELGESKAWCWQQGCMLQWLPGSSSKILWNDRQGDKFVCHLLDVKTKEKNTIPNPIYSISPDGKYGITPDFSRVQDMRPGYGYVGLKDKYADQLAPEESGIFKVDMQTGQSELILSLADVVKVGDVPTGNGIKHYFNHLLFNTDGTRFIVLHRWRHVDAKKWSTRMLTVGADGKDVRIIIDTNYASHFIWRDEKTILSQSKNYAGNPNWGDFLFEDKTDGHVEEVGKGILDPSGHLTYLPGNEWILNDTYPKGKERLQTPHLYHIESKRRIDLAHFHLPKIYKGEWRVDTHPRYCPNSEFVCVDAPVKGSGRQLHLLDISSIVG